MKVALAGCLLWAGGREGANAGGISWIWLGD